MAFVRGTLEMTPSKDFTESTVLWVLRPTKTRSDTRQPPSRPISHEGRGAAKTGRCGAGVICITLLLKWAPCKEFLGTLSIRGHLGGNRPP